MFRVVHTNSELPGSFVVDPSSEFQPGQIAELSVYGNQVVVTVSTGLAPLGVIDDMKTKAFTQVSWNEVVITAATGVPNLSGQLVTAVDISVPLKKPNIIKNSFTSTVDCILNENNGIVTFPAGTLLNFDLSGAGYATGIRAVVSYTYYVANIPGDDSTAGSGRVTVWYNRFFFQTDMYETNQSYPLKAPLYVNETGLLTTRKPSENHPSIGMVTAPPTTMNPFLEALWY